MSFRLAPLLLACAALPVHAQTECWVKRVEYADLKAPRFATLARAQLAAEALVAKNQAFLDTPVPVRMRTTFDGGAEGATVRVYPFPEKTEYSKVWIKGKCEVYPAADTIGAMIGSIGIDFNNGLERFFTGHEVPAFEGTVAGYPVYNGWVVMTKDRRLPWIPQTLADRIEREIAAREKKLAEWKATTARWKKPDDAALQRSAEMIRRTDPKAADRMLADIRANNEELERVQREVNPRMQAQLEASVAAARRYRAQFSPEQLAAPATWTDKSGAERKKMETAIRALRELPAERKQEIAAIRLQARDVARQLQEATHAKDTDRVAQLKADNAALTRKARAIQQQFDEQAATRIAELSDDYALQQLKPGGKEDALAYKADPAFLKYDPNRITYILVNFTPKKKPEIVDWMRRAQDNFDFAALAALLK